MNIKEIAQLAGVSASTISKILNHKDESISEETRQRVLKIVKEYNYSPYASVTSTQKTWTIGILIGSSSSFANSLNGIVRAAQESGYVTSICDSMANEEQELKNITALCKNHVDGVLWEPVSENSLKYATYFTEQKIPFITLGANGGEGSLTLPIYDLAYCMTEELIQRKHNHIACLLTNNESKNFLSGYKKCLFKYQLSLNEDLIFSDFNTELIYKINSHQITGVISSDYPRALEFYQFMHSLHYSIPNDFSLITLKNDTDPTLSYPQLSTYTISNFTFGCHLCNLIINKIEKKTDLKSTFSQSLVLDNTSTIGNPYRSTKSKILVIGSINMDTYLNVKYLPNVGTTISAERATTQPGGKGTNQAVAVARLGVPSAIIGKIGSDLTSDIILKTLNDNSVDTRGIMRCKDADTGKSYIFVDSNGKSMISILSGANGIITPEDLYKHEYLFDNTAYCLIQSEIPLDTTLEACRIARKHNIKTILKPSSCFSMTWEMLSYIDIIVPNEDELFALCSKFYPSMEAQAASMLECGIQAVIVTLGERGCYVKTNEWDEYFPSFKFPVIDTTGASDAFISALAAYLSYDYDLKTAVQIASYAAGFCVSREGVIPALIDKTNLEAYIQRKNPELLHSSIE